MGESEPVAATRSDPATTGAATAAAAAAADADADDARGARLIAGAMSGTSGDGVDVAITSVTGRGLAMHAKLVRHHHVPYDAELKKLLFAIRESGSTSLADLARLGREVSLTYARAVNEALAAERLHASDL